MMSTDTADRALIYARQSLDKKGDEAAVDRQVASCTKQAEAREITLTREPIIDNDLSGYSGKTRPGYEKVRAMIAAREIEVLLVWDMDRLTRSVAELVDLLRLCRDAGWHTKIITVHGDYDLSTPIGRMFATMLIAIAEYESAHKAERQVAANGQAAARGKRWTGCPRPFGWRDDHKTPEPAEAEAIAEACRALLGGSTVSAVCREWAKRGLLPPQPRRPADAPFGPLPRPQWTRTSVTTILRNPRLAGLAAYRGDEITVEAIDWAPLVPEETWRAVDALLKSRDRTIVDKNGKPRQVRVRTEAGVRTLLGGIARCQCGNQITASRNQLGQPVYRCDPPTRGDRPGPHVATRIEPVDIRIAERIAERMSRPDAIGLIGSRPGTDVRALREESAAIRSSLDELAADRVAGLVSRSQLIKATERGNIRLAELDGQISEAGRESVLLPLVAADRAADAWRELDLSRQRAVVRTLITVTLRPAGRGARKFDPDNVVITPVPAN